MCWFFFAEQLEVGGPLRHFHGEGVRLPMEAAVVATRPWSSSLDVIVADAAAVTGSVGGGHLRGQCSI